MGMHPPPITSAAALSSDQWTVLYPCGFPPRSFPLLDPPAKRFGLLVVVGLPSLLAHIDSEIVVDPASVPLLCSMLLLLLLPWLPAITLSPRVAVSRRGLLSVVCSRAGRPPLSVCSTTDSFFPFAASSRCGRPLRCLSRPGAKEHRTNGPRVIGSPGFRRPRAQGANCSLRARAQTAAQAAVGMVKTAARAARAAAAHWRRGARPPRLRVAPSIPPHAALPARFDGFQGGGP